MAAENNTMDESMLRIAMCDDDKTDRERVHGLVTDYLKEKNLHAQVKVFLILLCRW